MFIEKEIYFQLEPDSTVEVYNKILFPHIFIV